MSGIAQGRLSEVSWINIRTIGILGDFFFQMRLNHNNRSPVFVFIIIGRTVRIHRKGKIGEKIIPSDSMHGLFPIMMVQQIL